MTPITPLTFNELMTALEQPGLRVAFRAAYELQQLRPQEEHVVKAISGKSVAEAVGFALSALAVVAAIYPQELKANHITDADVATLHTFPESPNMDAVKALMQLLTATIEARTLDSMFGKN